MINNFLDDLRGHQRRIDAHENLWKKCALIQACSRSIIVLGQN